MNPLPLVISCAGDYALHLIPATREQRVEEIAALAATFVIGVRVAPSKEYQRLRLRRIESKEFLPRDAIAGEMGLKPMDWLELTHEQ